MKIWIIDHYATPERYCPLIRQTIFARKLNEMGHQTRIFAASTVHNSDINLIMDGSPFKEEFSDGVHYTYVRCHGYQDNGIKRILNMKEFARKLPKVCDAIAERDGTPDAILACSMTLEACRTGIKLAKKYEAKVIAQISDIWSENLVEYGYAKRGSMPVRYYLNMEHWVYTHADRIIFTCEGGYDYIIEQHWENEIPREKVKYINNGVDLEQFNFNKEHFQIDDEDLKNPDIFKVVYTGSIRRVNNLGLLLDTAKEVKDPTIKFLIWGDGDELPVLKRCLEKENISNVAFKGRVEKKYIPYITSQASLNLAHNNPSSVFRYGISFNKIFDYAAAGKPTLSDFPCKYNPLVEETAGISVDEPTARNVADAIVKMKNLSDAKYQSYCEGALRTADKYDFRNLTKKLINIIEEI